MKKKKKRIPLALILLLVIVLLGIVIFLVVRYRPGKEHLSLNTFFGVDGEEDGAVIANGNLISTDDKAPAAKLVNGTTYVRWSLLHDHLDDGWVYDASEGILRYATDKNLISVNLSDSNYMEDKNSKSWSAPIVIVSDNKTYVALDFVKQFTDLTYTVANQPNRLAIWTAGTAVKTGSLNGAEGIRRKAGIKSQILEDGKSGDSLTIVQELDGWYQVVTADNVIGCVRKSKVSGVKDSKIEANLPERQYSHRILDQKIQLAWHQVTSTAGNANMSNLLANTSGINVISPTWFSLKDNGGNLNDYGSSDYVTKAHSENVAVWGLVSNLASKGVDTKTVLNTTSARDNLVNGLIAAAIRYNLDGINVDIESLPTEAADGYIQFIRELSLKAHANNLVVSVDNYTPSASSLHYNRAEQANYADYNVIMAYDEHWATDKTAGSNSSIDYVKKAVSATLETTPARQVILALPLYTRAWTTKSDGSVSSQAVAMKDQDALLAQNKVVASWNEELGQSTASWKDADGNKVEIWLENADSIAKKMEVYRNNQLGGVAFWKLGMEPSSIWQTVSAGK
ncbi:glycosyl hydrolase family 18 protein [Shuttleworthella satelles]|uniref:Glycosyl hydrolase, family 18 n=1 Tax=Shuttleworthella satelles DSM 14600 TaxID=626523 RepID=C4GC45_9FIRM|nr:glycosyl hydrolase family 18 protein [Shuttleworthia satelles]EEP27987.1 glycosyl hydrolase, family 18 [Shuttleworthia satelles DSM 14600]